MHLALVAMTIFLSVARSVAAVVTVAVVARNCRRVVDMRSPFKEMIKKYRLGLTSIQNRLKDVTPLNILAHRVTMDAN